MRSITIVPNTVPSLNEPTPCTLIIVGDDGLTKEYAVVLPENMLTVISNPPDLSNYAKTSEVKEQLDQAYNSLKESILTLTDDVSNLPRVTDTSNFITYDKLSDESSARKSDVNSINDSISDIKQTCSDISTSIKDINSTIADRVSKINELAKTYKLELDTIKTIKDNSISGGDNKSVSTISLSGDDITLTSVNGDNYYLVTKSDLNDIKKSIEEDYTSKLDAITKKYDSAISGLVETITTGNKLLTDTFSSLNVSGMETK